LFFKGTGGAVAPTGRFIEIKKGGSVTKKDDRLMKQTELRNKEGDKKYGNTTVYKEAIRFCNHNSKLGRRLGLTLCTTNFISLVKFPLHTCT
jgi:hypothetical protein